jgi:hypothetical protein
VIIPFGYSRMLGCILFDVDGNGNPYHISKSGF